MVDARKNVGGRPSIRDERRQHVLELALGIIAVKGLDAFQMRDVTDALELSPAAIYRHFRSRDEVIVQVQEFALRELHAVLVADQELLAPHLGVGGGKRVVKVNALAALLVAAKRYLTLDRALPGHHALIAHSIGRPEALVSTPVARRILPVLGELFALIAGWFERAAAVGALTPGDGAARARGFWASVHGVTQIVKLDRLEPGWLRPLHTGMEVAETLLRGWGAPPAALAAAVALVASVEPGPSSPR